MDRLRDAGSIVFSYFLKKHPDILERKNLMDHGLYDERFLPILKQMIAGKFSYLITDGAYTADLYIGLGFYTKVINDKDLIVNWSDYVPVYKFNPWDCVSNKLRDYITTSIEVDSKCNWCIYCDEKDYEGEWCHTLLAQGSNAPYHLNGMRKQLVDGVWYPLVGDFYDNSY